MDSSIKYCTITHAITLETMFCQVCGEIYYRGYHNDELNKEFVSNEIYSEKLSKDTRYVYLNFNENEFSVASNKKTKDISDSWKSAYFNGFTGELSNKDKYKENHEFKPRPRGTLTLCNTPEEYKEYLRNYRRKHYMEN